MITVIAIAAVLFCIGGVLLGGSVFRDVLIQCLLGILLALALIVALLCVVGGIAFAGCTASMHHF